MCSRHHTHFDAPALLLSAAALCGVLIADARSFLEILLAVAIAVTALWTASNRMEAAKYFMPVCAAMALWTAFWAPNHIAPDYQLYKGIVTQCRTNEFSQSGIVECPQGRVSFVYGGMTPELAPGDSICFKASVSAPDRYHGIPFMAMHDMTNRASRVGGSVFLNDGTISVTGHSQSFRYKMTNLRRTLADATYASGLSPEASRLLVAACLGTGDADIEMKEQMRSMGLAHLLCVSGFHVGVIASIIAALLFPLQLSTYRRTKYFLIPVVVWLYALLCGFAPSVIRAGVMITTFYFLRYFQRKSLPLNALAISFVVVLIINPYWLFSAGFQLSFVAVAGILIFAVPLIERIGGPRKLAAIVLVPLFASLATLPVLLAWFHKVALLSVPFNIIGTIIFPVFMIAGIIAVIMWHIGIGGSLFCMIANKFYGLFTLILDELAATAEQWQFTAHPGCAAIILLSVALIFAAYALAKRRVVFAACSVAAVFLGACDIDHSPQAVIVVDNDNVHYCHADSSAFISRQDNAVARQYTSMFEGYGHFNIEAQNHPYAEILNKRILFLENNTQPRPCDILIVTPNFSGNLANAIEECTPSHITLSSRMPPRRRIAYQYTCREKGIATTMLSHRPLVIFPQ